MRIDKWLFAMRLFKSRSLASAECEKGKISIDGQQVKPSRILKIGDKIAVRQGGFTMDYEVLNFAVNRLSANKVTDYCKDITLPEEVERKKLFAIHLRAYGKRGEGRPTKRDRRELDDFTAF